METLAIRQMEAKWLERAELNQVLNVLSRDTHALTILGRRARRKRGESPKS
jgi:hypothetical protein